MGLLANDFFQLMQNTFNIRVKNIDIKNSHCEKVFGQRFNHIPTIDYHT